MWAEFFLLGIKEKRSLQWNKFYLYLCNSMDNYIWKEKGNIFFLIYFQVLQTEFFFVCFSAHDKLPW